MTNENHLKECYIVRNAAANGYNQDFTELAGVEVLTTETVENYIGSFSGQEGSIVYKCTPIFIIEQKPSLTPIANELFKTKEG